MFTVAAAVVMGFVTCVWSPSLKRTSPRQTARELQDAFGVDRPYVFYGVVNIPTVWYLRTPVPAVETEDALRDALAREPRTVVLAMDPAGDPPKPLPGELTVWRTYAAEEKTMRVCVIRQDR